jgi:hypothetical protein
VRVLLRYLNILAQLTVLPYRGEILNYLSIQYHVSAIQKDDSRYRLSGGRQRSDYRNHNKTCFRR